MKYLVFVTLCLALGVNSMSVVEGEQEASPFIINGVRSPSAPYYAFVQYFNAQGHGFFGGGALISIRHVLTAATNVLNFQTITVHLGSTNRTAMRPHQVDMQGLRIHPDYVATTRANDIAIIRLVNPAVLSAEIAIINLPPVVTPALVLPHEFEEGMFAGFGFTSNAATGPSQFLNRGYQRVTGATRCTTFFGINTNSGFCAEDTVERASGCHGDVGNPFVLSYRRQDHLVGILTMHPPCGQMSPTAYTRVTHFLPWIAANQV